MLRRGSIYACWPGAARCSGLLGRMPRSTSVNYARSRPLRWTRRQFRRSSLPLARRDRLERDTDRDFSIEEITAAVTDTRDPRGAKMRA